MAWIDVANALQAVLRVPLAAPGFPATKVYVGWPEPNKVLEDLRVLPVGSRAHVSIYPFGPAERATRYLGNVQAFILAPTTEITTPNVVTKAVTFAGAGVVGDNVFVFVNKRCFGTTIQAGDTNEAIAGRIAASINAVVGFGITAAVIPGPPVLLTLTSTPTPIYALTSRTFGQAIACTELGRFMRSFMVSVWAADNTSREKIGTEIINKVSSVEFITLADGTKVRAVYESDEVDDRGMPSGVMRHDVFVMTEYPQLKAENVPLVACPQLTLDVIWAALTSQVVIDGNPFGLGGSSMGDHLHIHETPIGGRPGQAFTLSYPPIAGSELLYRNTVKLEPVAMNPGVNEYVIVGQSIVTGDVIEPGDVFKVHYEVQR